MVEGGLFVKVWNIRPGETMVAVCDCGILGKKVCEGKLVLDVSKDFYGGERLSLEAATDILKRATVANLVGEDAVRCGLDAGLVHEEAVITIGGIPHAQFVMI
jgi:hypothetical protein